MAKDTPLPVRKSPPSRAKRARPAGLRAAEAFRARGLIEGAALFLQGEVRLSGAMTDALLEEHHV